MKSASNMVPMLKGLAEDFEGKAFVTPVDEFRAMVREVLAERARETPAFVTNIIEEGPQRRGAEPKV